MLGRRTGFTLIELLIVVAIIAILAGIAIVNFLEAQTRAKVGRALNDMRVLARGLVAYRTDSRSYPEAAHNGVFLLFEDRLLRLTTPVAYITSLPLDPFSRKANFRQTYGYNDRANTESVAAVAPLWAPFPGSASSSASAWSMISVGPDQAQSLMVGTIPVQYDATNGSVSFGDLHRFGP